MDIELERAKTRTTEELTEVIVVLADVLATNAIQITIDSLIPPRQLTKKEIPESVKETSPKAIRIRTLLDSGKGYWGRDPNNLYTCWGKADDSDAYCMMPQKVRSSKNPDQPKIRIVSWVTILSKWKHYGEERESE